MPDESLLTDAAEGKASEQDKFIVRLPPGMRTAIAAAAKENGRSMNAEVVMALARYAGGGETRQMKIRVPLELHRLLEEAALGEHRSINSLVVSLIEESLT